MGMRRKYHRVGFSALQSAELWDRWKKGEGLHAIGRVLGKTAFLHFQSSKAQRRDKAAIAAAVPAGADIGRARGGLSRPCGGSIGARDGPPSVARLVATVGLVVIVRRSPISVLGNKPCVQSCASWRFMLACGKLLLRNWKEIGRPSRSQAG